VRLDRLRGADALAGAGGLLLAFAMFLPWFGKVSPFCVPLPGHSCGRNFDAWEVFDVTDLILAAAALAGIAVGVLAGASSKTDAQISSASIAAPIAALATILTLYRVIDPVGKLDPLYGLYVGLAACLATTYGCWRAVRNDQPSRVARRSRQRPASRTRSPSSSD
jgi:hypothetical protein